MPDESRAMADPTWPTPDPESFRYYGLGPDGMVEQRTSSQHVEYPGVSSTDPHWIESEEQEFDNWLELRDPHGWYTATIKHDGCIELSHAANSPFCLPDGSDLPDWVRRSEGDACDDFYHICDLDELIARLEALRPFLRSRGHG